VILSKEEFLSSARSEVRLLLHLASKVDAGMLHFRPTPSQRSLLGLLQYLTIMGPIHIRAVLAPSFDMDDWRRAWREGEAAAGQLNLDQVRSSIAEQSALLEELLRQASDDDLRHEITMFGHKASRGALLVDLVLRHYAAYRMQLFLYLKACGREELSTLNLWAGIDAF